MADLRSATGPAGVPGLILMYHRIGTACLDPWGLSVSAENFRQQIAHLAAVTKPVALPELADATRWKSDIPVAAVTFDDGYIDNLTIAAPVLADRGVPATVFVVTGYLDAGREFWWDELTRLLLGPSELPARPPDALAAILAPDMLHAGRFYAEAHRDADRHWFITRRGKASARVELFILMHQWLMGRSDDQRRGILDSIAQWLGEDNHPRDDFLCCTKEEARRLDAIAGIELGAHTATHPLLSALSSDEQRREIARSHTDLRHLTGRPVRSFSYPYGAYTAEARNQVRDTGVLCACCTHPGVVTPDTDRYTFPRFKVGNWDQETFAAKLAEWIHPVKTAV